MGKSEGEGNAVFLMDESEAIRKKVMRAKTDSGPTQPNQAKPDEINNLFLLMNVVSQSDTIKYFEEQYNNCTIRYGDFKKQLAEDMIAFTTPIREKIKGIISDKKHLKKLSVMGAEKARSSARNTINEVREIIGFK